MVKIPCKAMTFWRSGPGAPCLVGLLLLLLSNLASAAGIRVAVEPDPPLQGESFRLAFSLEGDLSSAPDFSVLEENFDILARNEQNAVAFVNGKYTRKTTWVLEVLPRETGPVQVPAVGFGQESSEAFTVTPRVEPGANAGDEGLFLEVEAEPRNPYVQQEVRYTVRLWRRYELSNASLSEPQLSGDALVKPLEGDRQYVQERDGRRYDVVERSYLLYPQQSGEITIQPVRVTAQVLERAASLFEMLGRAVKTRRVDSAPVTLEVRPIPDGFPKGAHWLPARQVRLNELWTPESGPVKVGEPLSRTLSLWASGVTSGQLPVLAPAGVEGLRQYPDQPQLQDTLQNGEQHAVRQEKIAYLADGPGAHALPAIAIPWWNTETDSLEHAEVPLREMQVEPALGAYSPPATQPDLTQSPVEGTVAETPPPSSDWRNRSGWFELALFALVGWVATAIWAVRRGPRAAPASSSVPRVDTPDSAQRALALVTAACVADDAAATHRALLAWSAAIWPDQPALTLEALAQRVDPAVATLLLALDRACHGPAGTRWQGAPLAEAMKTLTLSPVRTGRASSAGKDALPGLFRLAGNTLP